MKKRLAALSALLALTSAFAGDIVGGRIYTVPEKVYVNQAFDIHLDLEVTFGSEVEDPRVSDFPNNPEFIVVDRLESLAADRVTRDGQTITVHRFAAKARAVQPFARTFSPTVQCMLVERRNAGFFSHWQSFPKQRKLPPFPLDILPLPAEGRPDAFSGAIGRFALSGRISQTAVQPGDIVTLSLELSGQGWLPPDAAMPAPPPSPLFKAYPAKELLRQPAHLKTEQVLIPQSTDALEIAAACFTFFNPATGRYEESAAGPFRLTFINAPADAPTPGGVRVIDTAPPTPGGTSAPVITLQQVNQRLRHAVPLLAGCVGALAAFFVFFLLVGTHRRLAVAAGLLILSVGIGAGHLLSGRADLSTRRIVRRTAVTFAPSNAAATLFSLNPDARVTPLEECGAWVRIDASGRRGWIRAEALAE
jgi:hypothetical protein